MENERRFPLATAAVFFFALAGAARVFAAHTDDYSCAYPDNVHFPLTLSYPAGGKPQVLRLDFGEASTGGYAVFDVASAKGSPVMRVAYANHPDGLGEKGCFSRETSARYLGPTFDIPALPGNINRHEIYRICRTGRFAHLPYGTFCRASHPRSAALCAHSARHARYRGDALVVQDRERRGFSRWEVPRVLQLLRSASRQALADQRLDVPDRRLPEPRRMEVRGWTSSAAQARGCDWRWTLPHSVVRRRHVENHV